MKDKKINADQARLKYFNYYVEFEHNLRDLLRIIDKKVRTKNKSLKQVITLIKIKTHKPIKIKTFMIHLSVRN